ncbi:hypothetical protein PLEOSDRAFT_1108045 [Pleurotus ostreatus PC15]|uniref:Uncharacterized protein n=1 Tax=Pleurotus ostreatus (strain PC15) TaxID=1137138 RepID=A0A067N684_PLEO1|nr:hypothetical protein PLEOSDRAFT_1108045 [Pleurotus ostreatus PC15]
MRGVGRGDAVDVVKTLPSCQLQDCEQHRKWSPICTLRGLQSQAPSAHWHVQVATPMCFVQPISPLQHRRQCAMGERKRAVCNMQKSSEAVGGVYNGTMGGTGDSSRRHSIPSDAKSPQDSFGAHHPRCAVADALKAGF